MRKPPLIPVLLLSLCLARSHAQSPEPVPQHAPESSSGSAPAFPAEDTSQLPDSPSASRPTAPQSVIVAAKASFVTHHTEPPPCRNGSWFHRQNDPTLTDPNAPNALNCVDILNPYARFLDTRFSIPMSPAQKGYLAFRNISDPFNLATIVATSGFTIAIDSHTAYGPGWKGFGKNVGVNLLQDVTGEFFGTFAIPSLTHEDPHYHRLPRGSVPQRIVHAVSRTIIAQHDDGTPMPNYSTLLTYPIASEISNLYVPGIQGNGPSTAKRIALGYALDPVNNLITEFLPDVAKRIHIRIIFVQQILNQVVVSGTGRNEQ